MNSADDDAWMAGPAIIQSEAAVVNRGRFRLGPIDLDVGSGTTIFLGRNGAGKTTLLRTFLGLEPLASGTIRINGQDVSDRSGRRALMRGIGFAPQGAALPHTARVADTVEYAAWLKGVSPVDSNSRVGDALAQLNISSLASRRIGQLSGGERQRVSIAMALVHDPEVVFLDEPSAGLDPVQRVSLRRMLDRIAQERAVVLSTHLIEEVRTGPDSVVVLRNGSIAFQGTSTELEAGAAPLARGDSDLERAVWCLLGGDEDE